MSILRMWVVALLFPLATIVASIPTISISGNKFYDSYGNQFYIKGVVYGSLSELVDVLANTAQCQRDVQLMQKLGVNTISVYYIDTAKNHDGCMLAFENAGIYVLVNLASVYSAINRADPAWTPAQYGNFTAVMDAFATYDNTLGFVAGNEVVNDLSTSNAALYVKASVLDLKKYRDGKEYREIPVGYAGADSSDLEPVLQNYLACGAYAIDFYGQNSYSWCSPSSFTESGFSEEYADASSYNIPIFFSEIGCTTNPPRDFTEMAAVLGADMENVWSGAIVYEWADNIGYGLVSYASTILSGTPTPAVSGGFSPLMSQWATLSPTGTPSSLYTPNVTPPSCPSATATGWLVSGSAALPTLNKAAVSTRTTTSSSSSSIQGSSSTSTSSGGTSKGSGATPGVESGTTSGDGSHSTSDPVSNSDAGLSSAIIAGIAIGVILLFMAGAIIVYLLWRRRRHQQPKTSPSLDLTPEGLEVGEAPARPELDSSEVATEHGNKPELQDTSPTLVPNGYMLGSSPALTTSTFEPSEMGSSPTSQRASRNLASELSITPAIPKLPSVQEQPPVTRRPVPSSNQNVLKANAPWENESFPYPQAEVTTAQAQQTPLLSTSEDDDELRQLEDEERQIDAQIAESERIRALKQEKLLLQARKTALLEAKEKRGRT